MEDWRWMFLINGQISIIGNSYNSEEDELAIRAVKLSVTYKYLLCV